MKLKRLKKLALIMLVLSAFSTGCGSAGPPLSIPAPTGGWITVTAPSELGKSLVFGYIIVESVPLPGVDVVVTNTDSGESSETTTDEEAFFSTDIDAAEDDTITVAYVDPITGETSEPATFTADSDTQPMPSGFTPQDVDLDSDSGMAYVVLNDGTDSQIIEIDLSTGAINSSATFPGVIFSKIAVHSTLNRAAIIDTTSATNSLKWCDVDDFTQGCNSYTTKRAPRDVSVVDVAAVPITTDDFVLVTYNYQNTDYAFASTYPILSGNPTVLDGGAELGFCIASPKDGQYATNPTGCTLSLSPEPSDASVIDLRLNTTNNRARMSMVASYDDGSSAIHFFYFQQPGSQILPEVLIGDHVSAEMTAGIAPYDLKWYDLNNALLTDTAGGQLIEYQDTGGTIVTTTLSVGTAPRGIYPDSTNNRAFVAEQNVDVILNIDMTTFQLSGTYYEAIADPTELVYYQNQGNQYLGVIQTAPTGVFRTINITP